MNADVNDKLKGFTEKILSNIENESKQKIEQAAKENTKALETEKQILTKESQAIINNALKKADEESKLILSKANGEMEHALLIKRNEIYKNMEDDIRSMAHQFTKGSEYQTFLYISVDMGISKIDANELHILLKPEDIERFGDNILYSIKDKRGMDLHADLVGTDEDIIGGCIVENTNHSRRVDCTIAALLTERMEIAGRLLLQSL
jgi:vacuolar-type H+-ATPase subunit E/Vma4